MSMMKGANVPISSKGTFLRPVIADEQDLHLFVDYNWSDNGNGYLRAYDKSTGKNVYLHRLIAEAKPGQTVDHVNGDTYDVRRSNLRFTTHNRNLNSHRGKRILGGPVSRHIGVSWLKLKGKWSASFRGKYLGIFANEDDAGIAYDAERVRLGFEPINFKR